MENHTCSETHQAAQTNGMMTHLETIFTSIQGEGIYVGVPQLFIRFSGCNLKCRYCDTPEARVPHPMARIENKPFQRNFKLICNPVKTIDLNNEVFHLIDDFPEIHSVALTGGEPLVATGFLKNFLPLLKQKKLMIFLETNGTLPNQLKSILEFIDIISMDIKIPSAVGREVDWNKTEEFLKLSRQRNVYTKILVTGQEKTEELTQARSLISRADKKIPLVLQPFTPLNNHRPKNGNGCSRLAESFGQSLPKLLETYQFFRQELSDVRIIPQVHKLAGWL